MFQDAILCAEHVVQGLADIENNIAREMTKLGAVIQVPFRSGNQFLGEGGLQVRLLPLALRVAIHRVSGRLLSSS